MRSEGEGEIYLVARALWRERRWRVGRLKVGGGWGFVTRLGGTCLVCFACRRVGEVSVHVYVCSFLDCPLCSTTMEAAAIKALVEPSLQLKKVSVSPMRHDRARGAT